MTVLPTRNRALLLALAGFGAFAALILGRGPLKITPQPVVADRIVISAPVQVLLAGGDRFLAADFEAIRIMATGDDSTQHPAAAASFHIRAHGVVAQLNPCHEDNYYVANATLSWGGAPTEGLDVLRRATDCRFWDEWPPFFLGLNQWFFKRDIAAARHAFEQASQRTSHPEHASSLRRMGIMIEAGELRDDSAALDFLQYERRQTNDPKLQGMLDMRITRLEGLIALRDAQARYEAQAGQPLTDPQALLQEGLLGAFPQDPLRLGYEFANGQFRLREVKIPGMEPRR